MFPFYFVEGGGGGATSETGFPLKSLSSSFSFSRDVATRGTKRRAALGRGPWRRAVGTETNRTFYPCPVGGFSHLHSFPFTKLTSLDTRCFFQTQKLV